MFTLAFVLLFFMALAAVASIVWCFFRSLIAKGRRLQYLKKAGFGFLALVAVLVSTVVLSVFDPDVKARQSGFESATDQMAAQSAGFSDPVLWGPKREELRKAQAASEAARKAEAEKAAADAQAEIKKIAAAKVAEEARLRAEEERKKKDAAAACLADLACVWKEQSVYMSAECKVAVQRLAKWDYEWTDGWTDRAFSPVWLEKDNGLVLLSGDKLKLQNGFGAWKHVSYLCTYNPAIKQAVSASVVE